MQAQHQQALASISAQQAQSSGQAAELRRQLEAAQTELEGLRRRVLMQWGAVGWGVSACAYARAGGAGVTGC